MPRNRVPVIVKHCTVAIFTEGRGIRGSTKSERFEGALQIARARLTEYGFLARGSETGDPNRITLTAKGRKREAVHKREVAGKRKDALFDRMWKIIEDQELNETADDKTDKDEDTT